MARHVAKTAVAAGAAKQLELQLGYAIGVSEPVSVSVETFGTGRLPDDVLCDWVRNCFDLRPGAIIQYLKLDSPICERICCISNLCGELEEAVLWKIRE